MASLRSKVATALLAGIAVVSLSGCTGEPGAVLIGDGISFSESDISTAVTEWGELTGSEPGQEEMVNFLAQAPGLLQFASEQKGIVVGEETLESMLSAINESNGTEITLADLSDATALALEAVIANQYLAYSSVTTEDYVIYAEMLQDSTMQVNPRYGTYSDGVLQALSPLADVMSVTDTELEVSTDDSTDTDSDGTTDDSTDFDSSSTDSE